MLRLTASRANPPAPKSAILRGCEAIRSVWLRQTFASDDDGGSTASLSKLDGEAGSLCNRLRAREVATREGRSFSTPAAQVPAASCPSAGPTASCPRRRPCTRTASPSTTGSATTSTAGCRTRAAGCAQGRPGGSRGCNTWVYSVQRRVNSRIDEDFGRRSNAAKGEKRETHCAMIKKTRRGECVVCKARSRDLWWEASAHGGEDQPLGNTLTGSGR